MALRFLSFFLLFLSFGRSVNGQEAKLASVPLIRSFSPAPAVHKICEGAPHRLSVTAAGSGLGYEWRDGAGNVVGHTPVLDFGRISLPDSGAYCCRVFNERDTVEQCFHVEVEPAGTYLYRGAYECVRETFRSLYIHFYGGYFYSAGGKEWDKRELYGLMTCDDPGRLKPYNQARCSQLYYEGKSVLSDFPWLEEECNRDGSLMVYGYAWLPLMNQYLVLRDVQPEDAREYKWIVYPEQCRPDTLLVRLQWYVPVPVPVPPLRDTVVCRGDKVVLRKLAGNTRIEWRLDDGTWLYSDSLVVTAGERDVLIRYFHFGPGCGRADGIVRVSSFTPLEVYGLSPQDTSVCEGGRVVFRSDAAGDGLRYLWRRERDNSLCGRGPTLSLSPVSAADTGFYLLEISDTCGNVEPARFHVGLLDDYSGVRLSPRGVEGVCPGTPLPDLRVSGAGGYAVQWRLPGGSLREGASLGGLLASERTCGTYRVRVSGGRCRDYSDSITFSLLSPLSVSFSPPDAAVCDGGPARFSVTASGDGLRYRWEREGHALSSSSFLSLPSVTASDTGLYACRLGGSCGDTLLPFRLSLLPPTRITRQPPLRVVLPGEPVNLAVEAEGKSLTCRWLLDGREAGRGFHLDAPSPSEEGSYVYRSVVTGVCGSAEGESEVRVRPWLEALGGDTLRLCEGGSLYLREPSGWEGGSGRGETVWYRGEREHSRGPSLELSSVSAADGGDWSCRLSGASGDSVLFFFVDVARFPLADSLLVSGASERFPGGAAACSGGSLGLEALVSDGGLHTYVWKKDGKELAGESGRRLLLSPLTESDGGVYTCEVKHEVCGSEELTLPLSVHPAPEFRFPSSVTACDSSEALLYVDLRGHYPGTFSWSGPGGEHWTSSGDGFSGEYRTSCVLAGDAGEYECRVGNACGDTVLRMHLSVERMPRLLWSAPGGRVCPGGSVDLEAHFDLPSLSYRWEGPGGEVLGEGAGNRLHLSSFPSSGSGLYEYRCIVNSGICFTRTVTFPLEVLPRLGELTLRGGSGEGRAAVCPGSGMRVEGFAAGEGVEYTWRDPGGYAFPSAVLSFPGLLPSQCGYYELTARDACGDVRTAGVEVALLEDFPSPSVSRDTQVCEGAGLRLSVEGAGAVPAQWYLGGRLLGEGAFWDLPSVGVQDTGEYRCLLQGVCGDTLLVVRVGFLPLLRAQVEASPGRLCAGEEAVFRVSARGADVRYKWMRDGELLSRDSVLSLGAVWGGDAGIYECSVSSLCGAPLLYSLPLSVAERTRLTGLSPGRFVPEGEAVRFFARASGEDNRFVWTSGGDTLHVEEGPVSEFTVGDAGLEDTLYYRVTVAGACGRDSSEVTLRVGPYRRISSLTSDTLCEGSMYTYLCDLLPPGCYGDEPLTYEWGFRLSPSSPFSRVEGSGPLLRLGEADVSAAGEYRCEVSGACGRAEKRWQVVLRRLPRLQPLRDTSLTEGAEYVLSAVASGDALSYRWKLGDSLLGERGGSLSFSPALEEDGGRYRVEVSNACSEASSDMWLTVWRRTLVTGERYTEVSSCPGDTAFLSVEALGLNLRYAWYRGGEAVEAPLRVPLAVLAEEGNGGEYMCVVSGRGGRDTGYVRLEVLPRPAAGITGRLLFCPESAVQEYVALPAVEAGSRLAYRWAASGGRIAGRDDRGSVRIAWEAGEGEKRLSLSVTDLGSGCTGRREETVSFYASPEVRLSLADTVGYCVDALSLSGAYPSGGTYYLGELAVERLMLTDKERAYGLRYVYVSPGTGCRGEASDTVHVAGEPLVVLGEVPESLGMCRGAEVCVVERTAGSLEWVVEEGADTGDALCALFGPGAFAQPSGRVGVLLEDAYGCRSSSWRELRFVPLPRVSLSGDTLTGECLPAELEGRWYTPALQRWRWEPAESVEPLAKGAGEERVSVVGIAPDGRLPVMLFVEDTLGCLSSDTLTVGVAGLLRLEGGEVCEGESLRVEGEGYARVEWSDGSEEKERLLTAAGTYILVGEDAYGCRDTSLYRVRSLPRVTLRDTSVAEGEELLLSVGEGWPEEEGPYRVEWSDGTVGRECLVSEGGLYGVRVWDAWGCLGEASARVSVYPRSVYAPTAFLAEGSGENSRFYVKTAFAGRRTELYVYDRWGVKVFEGRMPGFEGGWDGTYRGEKCAPGAYVWVLYTDGRRTAAGTVVLIR